MKVIARNKRARFDYDISDTYVAGVVLTGPEVKSIKQGHVSLKGSYVTIQNDEAYLFNAHVSPYGPAAGQPHDETRSRKLLLRKNEVERIITAKQNGQTAVPLSLGLQRGLVKVEIGVGRGRKKHDKREYIRRRQADRDITRL